jgi:hypothetical protein
MYIIAIGWMFVVVCMAAVEATSASVIGGFVTLFLYGILPLALFLWLVGTPQRHRNRMRRAEGKRVYGASFGPREGKAGDSDDQ